MVLIRGGRVKDFPVCVTTSCAAFSIPRVSRTASRAGRSTAPSVRSKGRIKQKMARRRRPEKREILPDPRFGDHGAFKFMNLVMYEGKKSVAEQIVYSALETIEAKSRSEIRSASSMMRWTNVRPGIEVRSRRVGGATYQVPVEVRPERAQALAIRWLIAAARKRSENTMAAASVGRTAGCRQQPRHRRQEA